MNTHLQKCVHPSPYTHDFRNPKNTMRSLLNLKPYAGGRWQNPIPIPWWNYFLRNESLLPRVRKVPQMIEKRSNDFVKMDLKILFLKFNTSFSGTCPEISALENVACKERKERKIIFVFIKEPFHDPQSVFVILWNLLLSFQIFGESLNI